MIPTEKMPSDAEMRQVKEMKTYQMLEKLKVPFLRLDHGPLMTMSECEQAEKALDVRMCKNLFLCNSQKTKFYLLMMPGDKKFFTKELSHQLHISRLSFADAEFMEKYLDVFPGSVSVMGLMNDVDNMVELVIDSDILFWEYIGVHPCVNSSSLKIKVSDLIEKFLPAVSHGYTVISLSDGNV